MLNFYTEVAGRKTYVGQIKGVFASSDANTLIKCIASYVFPDDTIIYGIKVEEGYMELTTDYGKIIGEEIDE